MIMIITIISINKKKLDKLPRIKNNLMSSYVSHNAALVNIDLYYARSNR